MKTRRKAREAALQAMYQCDTLKDFNIDSAKFLFSIFFREEIRSETFCNENYSFCEELVSVAVGNIESIDERISAASNRWSIQRMSRVDRNVLRIAVAEMLFFNDIPVNVSINEAIEISKSFGTQDTPIFVNGLLDKIARSIPKDLDSMSARQKVFL